MSIRVTDLNEVNVGRTTLAWEEWSGWSAGRIGRVGPRSAVPGFWFWFSGSRVKVPGVLFRVYWQQSKEVVLCKCNFVAGGVLPGHVDPRVSCSCMADKDQGLCKSPCHLDVPVRSHPQSDRDGKIREMASRSASTLEAFFASGPQAGDLHLRAGRGPIRAATRETGEQRDGIGRARAV
jgi:hypothetical protein